MNDISNQSDNQLRERIRLETETIAWHELSIFFARGKVISVDPKLNLVDVAFQISKDNNQFINELTQKKLVTRIQDDTAKEWFDARALVRASVVFPWVLVQRVVKNKPADYISTPSI